MRDLSWKSGQDHDGLLAGLDAIERAAETPFVPRRRKDAVDEEALNSEATGERSVGTITSISPRSQALASIAESGADVVAELKCEIREQRRQILDYQRSAAGWMRERAALIAKIADQLEQTTVLEAAIEAIQEQRDGALEQSAELLAGNLRLSRALALSTLPCGHPATEFRLVEDAPNGSYCNLCLKLRGSHS